MAVKLTRVLERALSAAGIDQRLFLRAFTAWKASDEYQNYLFGKDSAYVLPKVDGVAYALRHVHLVPLKDETQLAKWEQAWKRRSRKTSDRVLVYVSGDNRQHLLIFILNEPDAHEIARMKTVQHQELMNGFAEVAAAFLENGDVLV